MENVKVDDEKFFAEGATELAPMSASDSLQVCVECLIGKQKKPILFKVTEPSSIPVAINFSKSNYPVIFRFEALGRSRGIEIKTFSVFSKEKEFLYSALTGLVLLDVQHLLESELLTINEERRGHRQHVGDKEQFLRSQFGLNCGQPLEGLVQKIHSKH
jgi:hypothetical protein